MQVFFGESLKNQIDNAYDRQYKKRYLTSELNRYLLSDSENVCCLYGLRRTGKTVMMHQAIRKINDYDNCLLIRCEADESNKEYDTMQMLRRAVEEHPECKYIFVDEITKTRNFIGTASFLADDYAKSGKKVVITGTDSFGFFLARHNELLGRVNMIHTTYISYKEYKYLLNKDLSEYIRFGGTLMDGEIFSNRQQLKEYLNSSIVYNIVHSLERWNQGRNNGILDEIIEHNELPSFINKIIEYHNRTFLAKVMNDDFSSHDLGSLIDLMTKHSLVDTEPLESEELTNRIRVFLGIKENPFSYVDEDALKVIIDYLKELDVLYEYKDPLFEKNQYLFTQVGVRYWQSNALKDALISSEEFNKNYNDAEKHMILQKIEQDICGGILEDIIFYQLSTAYKDNDCIKINKYRNNKNQEIDVLIENLAEKKTVAVEIKMTSDIYKEGQLKHLNNPNLISEIENHTGTRVVNKVVIYNGKTTCIDHNTHYINASDFLCSYDKVVKRLLSKNIKSNTDPGHR